MSNKRSGCLWVAFALVLGFSLFLNLVLVAGRTKTVGANLAGLPRAADRLEERLVERGDADQRIALIPVRGLISSGVPGRGGNSMVGDIKLQLEQAERDSKVKAIVLAIDSPGGEITASDIVYNAVRRVREKKPVVVSMGSMATSGGYYVACGGSWIIAHETTFTGSIGVIIQSLRYNDLLGKIGVVPQTFKSGAFKDSLSGMREMTPEEQAYVQHLVMEAYSKFYGIVASERKLSEAQLGPVADGRVITGKDALKEGLVNELGGIEEAFNKARELAGAPGAAVITYEETFRLGRFLRFFGGEAKGKVEINLASQIVPPLEPGKAYLLPSLYVP